MPPIPPIAGSRTTPAATSPSRRPVIWYSKASSNRTATPRPSCTPAGSSAKRAEGGPSSRSARAGREIPAAQLRQPLLPRLLALEPRRKLEQPRILAQRRRELHPDGQAAARHRERQRNGRLAGHVEYFRVGSVAVGIAIPAVEVERRGSAVDLPRTRRQIGGRRQQQHIDVPKRFRHAAGRRRQCASRAYIIDGGMARPQRHAGPGERLQFIWARLPPDTSTVVVDLLGGACHPNERREIADVRRVREMKLAHRVSRALEV